MSVSKVILNGTTLMDVTQDTVAAGNLLSGETAHGADGNAVTGTYVPAPAVLTENDVNFYDYDGTLLYSYTAADFAQLNSYPANPTHEGLTSQGWNWGLADAKSYVASYGRCDIGQLYIPTDGKTKIYISVDDSTKSLYLGLAVNGTAIISWGDETSDTIAGSSTTTIINTEHTYASIGDYVISLDITGSASILGDGTVYSKLLWKGITSPATANRRVQKVIKKAYIGNNISLGEYAFCYCLGLETITIPNTITILNDYIFWNCMSLKFVAFPSVSSIGSNCCSGCYALEKVSLPPGPTVIGSRFVEGTRRMESIVIPSGVTVVGTYAFNTCPVLKEIVLPIEEFNGLGISALNGCSRIKRISVPLATGSASSTFAACYNLEYINLPRVSNIQASLFQNCSNLKTLILGNVTAVGNYACQGCYNLEEFPFSHLSGTIGNYSFNNCCSLRHVIIPSGVTSINAQAFAGCAGLVDITFLKTTPPTIASTNVFNNISDDCIFYYPYNDGGGFVSYLVTGTNLPPGGNYRYIGFATYESGATLPTQYTYVNTYEETETINLTWYATKVDAITKTNAIATGNGNEIYCRYTSAV